MEQMMDLVDANLEFASLIGRVETGETVTLMRDGRPVARLVPISDRVSPDRGVSEQLKNFSKGNILGDDLTIREMIDFGRR